MSDDKEREWLQQENKALREALQRKDEELQQSRRSNQDVREGLKQAIIAIESLREQVKDLQGQVNCLQERIKTLEGQQAKDSHNSSLPPSSDRFFRAPKSLRQKSGKKPGGQRGHRGHHLRQVAAPTRCSSMRSNAASVASVICMLKRLSCQSGVK
jgi:transposase